MPRTLTQLKKDLLSQTTFNQVSYYGTICGEIKRRTSSIDSYKGGNYLALPIQVETQYYYYLSHVWKFVIVTESAHGYSIGEVIKASTTLVKN